LDLKTGQTVWTAADVQNREASAVLWRGEGKDCILCAGTGRIFCLDAAGGKALWSVPAGGSASTPAVSGQTMVFCGGTKDLGLTAYSLSLKEPKLLWNVPLIERFTSPVIFGGHVYVVGGGSGVMEFGVKDKGRALCVDLETGKVVWDQLVGAGAEFSSPILADGKLIVLVGTSLHLMKASPEGYLSLGQAPLGLARWVSPALASGKLFLRTNKSVVCYDLGRQ
jgi:outer membrane protein assembly factor BamB